MPFPWCKEFVFCIDDVSTRRRVLNRMQGKGTATEEVVNTFDIFRPREKCKHPKRVLIEGAPGIGKTTFCQKLAYDWAKRQQEAHLHDQEIDVLFLLKCRDIESGLWESIDEQLLPWDIKKEEREQFFKFVRDNQSKVLLVLDGLDELPPHSTSFLSDVVRGRELPECYLLTAQRDDGMGVRKYYDTLFQLEGFSEGDETDFFFKCFGIETGLLLACVDPLEDFMANPLDTILTCLLWENNPGIFPGSRTQLFKETVLSTLRMYGRKRGLSTNNKDLIEIYKPELEHLGSWALNALLEKKMCFKEDELPGQKRDLLDFRCFFVSLHSKRGPRYSFFHSSFQEFLAAWYLSLQVLNGKIDPEILLADTRYFRELNQVLSFVTGLVAEKDVEIAKTVIKGIASQVNQLKPDSPLKYGGYVRVALHCIGECEREKRNSLARILGGQLTIHEVALQGSSVGVNSLGEVPSSLDDDQGDGGDFGDVFVSFPSSSKVNSVFVSTFTKALKVNTSLTRVDLSGNNIGDPGAISLARTLQRNTTLHNVCLSRIQMKDAGASALAKALTVNTSLTRLDLSSNNIGDPGAISLARALQRNSTLESVNLSKIQMEGVGARALAKALTVNTSLTWLALSGNNIGDLGAISLAKALETNITLANLNLSCIQMGAGGVVSLAKALTVNTSLTWLALSGNNIGDLGAILLAKALETNTTLANLNLSWIQMGDAGVISLAKALTVNPSLTWLDLSGSNIGDPAATSLAEALKGNSTLTHLYMGHIDKSE